MLFLTCTSFAFLGATHLGIIWLRCRQCKSNWLRWKYRFRLVCLQITPLGFTSVKSIEIWCQNGCQWLDVVWDEAGRTFEVEGFVEDIFGDQATNHVSHFKINWTGSLKLKEGFEEIASKMAGGQWCIKIPVHIVNIHCTYGEYARHRKVEV